jgi:hypothetical protein
VRAVWLLAAAAASSTCGAAEMRPVTPGWQEVAVNKESGAVAIQSRIDSDVISLKLGEQVEVLRTDPTLLAVDKRRIVLDHMALADAWRGKSADAALAAYRDFVNADLQKRGWKEVAAERAKVPAGGNAPAIYWAVQAEGNSGGQTAKLTLCMTAAVAGTSIVTMSGLAEDAQGVPAIKRILTDALATLEAKKGTALGADVVGRLRKEAQRLVYRMASRTGVILLNDELASQQDRKKPSDDTQQFILPPSDMAEAAAAAVAGSPNGPFFTFVNDGRSQHTFLTHAYDPANQWFEYSDTTGSRSMLEAGNNLAGVEAVRKPNTSDRIWVVKKDQLKMVLSGMIVGGADLLAVGRTIHLGPLGVQGNTPDDAKQTDFFKWFHLEEVGKSAGDGGTIITYAPSAPKFRPLVSVRLQLAPGGWLRGAELLIKRRFIEDPKDETSARDIVKSFIAAAAMKADWNKIHRLHDEIFYLGSTKMMVSSAAAKDISIPLLPTDGYEVFTGRRGHFVDMLSRSRLWMENVVLNGEPALYVAIGAGG